MSENKSLATILATAYALNPNKGSEDGMGWNFVYQIARFNKVITVTRKNNQQAIEQYMHQNPDVNYQNMEFLYYDLPYFLRFWKKGARGAMLYYYLWQIGMPIFLLFKKAKFDIAHNLNFHNDWTPSFLWLMGKPLVWGPIGHHPKIPKEYLYQTAGKKAFIKDRMRWLLKQFFWKVDPFLKLTKYKAVKIFAMNSSVEKVLNIKNDKIQIMPSVASEEVFNNYPIKDKFQVLSVGRFVPLKGFDVTIYSFARFYSSIKNNENIHLTLIGSGPQKSYLLELTKKLKIEKAVSFIEWVDRDKLKEYYMQSSVFLFPSHEGAGMVVSEAMSYGLPVLCFDNEGPGEFITDLCGRKVPYSNYDESITKFKNHLNQLYHDSQLLDKMSAEANKRYKTNFNWDNRGGELSVLYEKVIKKIKNKRYNL